MRDILDEYDLERYLLTNEDKHIDNRSSKNNNVMGRSKNVQDRSDIHSLQSNLFDSHPMMRRNDQALKQFFFLTHY